MRVELSPTAQAVKARPEMLMSTEIKMLNSLSAFLVTIAVCITPVLRMRKWRLSVFPCSKSQQDAKAAAATQLVPCPHFIHGTKYP